MVGIIFKVFFEIVTLIGIILCYDARVLTKTWFGYGDQNLETTGMKMLGFIVSIIGALIVYFL